MSEKIYGRGYVKAEPVFPPFLDTFKKDILREIRKKTLDSTEVFKREIVVGKDLKIVAQSYTFKTAWI